MKRRLLMLNWRDAWHPKAGGAELVTLRILQILAAKGWQVEWFSAAYPGAPSTETIDGVRYVREGSQTTVHLCAFRRYRGTSAFDIVVDQINTIPFMTPLYMSIPHAAFIHQLAQGVWQSEKGPVLGRIGEALEPRLLAPYRRSAVISVSHSSIESLRDVGLSGAMHLIPLCVDEIADDDLPEGRSTDDIIVLGRITPSKRIEQSIAAAEHLRKMGWRGRLLIVGAGSERYITRLKSYAEKLHIDTAFMGRVTDEHRRTLLRTSAVLWMTSVREGWGLVVTEAARHGTPAVVYDVCGLRDAVKHGVTGYVVREDPEALASATWQMLNQDYCVFAARAKEKSLSYSWAATAAAFESAILQTIATGRHLVEPNAP